MEISRTERLVLRHLSEKHAAFAYELYNTPSFLKFVGDKNLRSIEEAKDYLRVGPIEMYRSKGFGLYLVELKSSREPIGICGLLKRDSLADVDIGFGFLPQYEGQGYALESAHSIMAFAKERLKLTRVVAITHMDNARSIRLLEKLGLEFERNFDNQKEQALTCLYAKNLTAPD